MARGGNEVALDGSKNVDWLAYLHDHGLRNTGAILLSRNPLAFAKSHHDATGAPVWQGVEIWRNIYNHTLRSLITRQIPFISMRHADLTSNPQGFYARLLEFMGLDGMVDVEQYFQFPVHALGGNVGAFVRYRDFNAQRYEAREAQNKRPLGVMEIEESKPDRRAEALGETPPGCSRFPTPRLARH